MIKRNLVFTALVFLLALAACADNDAEVADIKPGKAPEKQAEKINTDQLICPQVAILREAQVIHDYGGEKPDPAQLVSIAHMRSIEGDCGYREKGIDINFTLHMTAVHGKRLGSGQANFPYFIAIVDPAENVVRRQIMTAHFDFSDGEKKVALDEALHVFIPVTATAIQSGPSYRVLVGFKLPADQISQTDQPPGER